MKKLYTFIAGFAITIGAFAQNTIGVYDKAGNDISGQTITFWEPFDSLNPVPYFDYSDFVDVVNESSGPMTIKVIRQEVNIVQGTQDYLCWGNTCFGAQEAGTNPVWFPDDSVNVAAGDTVGKDGTSLTLQVYFQNYNQSGPRTYKVGAATYQYDFFDSNDPTNSSSILVKFDISYLTSAADRVLENVDFTLFPNPTSANSFIQFSGLEGKQEVSVLIRNMLGQEMDTYRIAANTKQVELNHEDYQKGIYFVSIQNKGEVIATKKLVVQ